MEDLSTQGKRFQYWVEVVQKESANSFAELVGIPDPGPIYRLMKDEGNFSSVTLKRIFAKFSEFPIDWIRTGEGSIPGLKSRTEDIEVLRLKEDLSKKDEEIKRLNLMITDLITTKVFLNNQFKEIIERQDKTIKEQQELINHLKSLTNKNEIHR